MVSGYCIRQSKPTIFFLSPQKVLLDSTVADGALGSNVNDMPVVPNGGISYDAIKREVPEQTLAMIFRELSLGRVLTNRFE